MENTIMLPLLCTRGVVIFPGQEVNIDVGRKASMLACEEAYTTNNLIFVVCQKAFDVENPNEDDLYEVGTLCKIVRYRKKDNYYRIGLLGLERGRINNFQSGAYFKCEYETLDEYVSDSTMLEPLFSMTTKEFERLPKNPQMPVNIDQLKLVRKDLNASELCDVYAQIFLLDYRQKQEFLSELDIIKRLMMVLENIKAQAMITSIDHDIENRVREKMEESQKDYYLREKMRAIKDELNDGNGAGDLDVIRDRVLNNPYPEHVKDKALDELSKLEMIPVASGEYGVTRTYLDWLLDIPWYEESLDNEDLNEASMILDEDHYGLEKVKERILEFLAVKQKTHSLNSPIICLVGPPGVGKTSLAKSVAKALDRKFVKASMGGVKDEAEIRGHRRTYLGSLPGRIIQGMKKAGVINPVFLIDEIDKMASDFKGDPSSAMLEVLDPEQNALFSDHYLEEPYDLSKVLFIATANYIENIPPALKDRLEIIELSSYTELEKVEIAKNHLVGKQRELNGLKASEFSIDDDLLLYLIRHYTKEAGVRQLERLISTLCRKSVLAIMQAKKKKIKVSKKLINEWLGKEKFEYGLKEKEDQIGTVTGLAYTSFGGDVLAVEVNYFEGKGNLIVTGQLGDVMKESTKIALDYIKANAKDFDIDPKFFESHDIHVHVPEGAVPKDGPSAGVTLTTAMVSAITHRKVKKDVAMTGEVTLRGHVLPIGGLKEKSLAAHRSGIKTILIPKMNVKDLDEVPSLVKENVDFIPCTTVKEVIGFALL